jgi:hypothetical protein
MCSDFLTSRDLIRSRKKHCLSSSISLHGCMFSSKLIRDVKRKRNREKEKRDNQYMSMSTCCHRERSNQTNTNHLLCCRPYRCFLGYSVRFFFFSCISHVRPSAIYCCYDDVAIYMHSLSFFFSFQSSLPSSSNNAYTHNTLFPFTSTSSFSLSLFFSSLAI